MIVRLTHQMAQATQLRCPPVVMNWIEAHATSYGKTQVEVDMPAIGWRVARDRMVEGAFGPLGGKQRSTPAAVYGAIHRISKALLRLEGHPGLRGQAVIGWVGDVIPAWWRPTGVYDPYPNGDAMELLVPSHEAVSGHHVTTWSPGPLPPGTPDSADWDEAKHLLFV